MKPRAVTFIVVAFSLLVLTGCPGIGSGGGTTPTTIATPTTISSGGGTTPTTSGSPPTTTMTPTTAATSPTTTATTAAPTTVAPADVSILYFNGANYPWCSSPREIELAWDTLEATGVSVAINGTYYDSYGTWGTASVPFPCDPLSSQREVNTYTLTAHGINGSTATQDLVITRGFGA